MTLSAVARSPGLSPPYQAAMTTAMVNETTGAKSPRVSETVSRTIATTAVAPIAIRYPCTARWNFWRIVVASRPGGAGATRAADHSGAQTWKIISELQGAPMQLRNCLHQAQTQTDAGRAATRIAAVETLRDLGFFFIGDAGAVVGHADLDRTVGPMPDVDLHGP